MDRWHRRSPDDEPLTFANVGVKRGSVRPIRTTPARNPHNFRRPSPDGEIFHGWLNGHRMSADAGIVVDVVRFLFVDILFGP
tara:strand:+ start:228 stop:473 length:246 start_codon:yes stop_codon:yes gene_type:complete